MTYTIRLQRYKIIKLEFFGTQFPLFFVSNLVFKGLLDDLTKKNLKGVFAKNERGYRLYR